MDSSAAGVEPDDQAVAWLVRLQSGRATAADRAAFAAWRHASPAHEAAARAAETLWRDVAATPTAASFAADRRVSDNYPGGASRRRMTRRAVLTGAIAASAAAVVIGSGALGPVAGVFADYATRVGERREVRLPDGSVAFLNTATALSLSYSDAGRQLTLHAGEALFEVAPDPGRPFVVAAGDGEARAIGTVFAVRRAGERVGVVVREGRVEVRAGGDAPVRLGAGQHVAFGAGHRLSAPDNVDAVAATAWTRGKLIFNRRPLGEVVAELERYQLGRIVVADDRLRTLEVTGVFELGDADGLLRTLERTLGVNVIRLPLLTLVR